MKNLEYINYQKIETLLDCHRLLIGLTNSIQVDITSVYVKGAVDSDDEIIYGLVLGNRSLDNTIRSSSVTDKTYKVAITYKQSSSNVYYHEIKKLTHELMEVNIILDKIEIAMSIMADDERELIHQVYMQGIKWSDTGRIRDKRIILEKLANVARITEEAYCRVMAMLDK